MPPSACSKRPRRCVSAPVNAPFSWPNSSDSSSSAGIAEVFSATNGFVCARAVLVQRARDQLLAGAGLAGDQHRHARARQAADGAEHLLHRRRLAEQLRDLRRLRRRVVAAPRGLAGAPHELDRLVDVERLRQVFEGAALVGRHRAVRSECAVMTMTGSVGCARAHFAQQVDAASCPACGCR